MPVAYDYPTARAYARCKRMCRNLAKRDEERVPMPVAPMSEKAYDALREELKPFFQRYPDYEKRLGPKW